MMSTWAEEKVEQEEGIAGNGRDFQPEKPGEKIAGRCHIEMGAKAHEITV